MGLSKRIDFSKLKEVNGTDFFSFLHNKASVMLQPGNTKYYRLNFDADGDRQLRTLSIRVLQKTKTSPDKIIKKIKELEQYRALVVVKNEIDGGAINTQQIKDLYENLNMSKNLKSLLRKLNNPCIDMTLTWLIRDLTALLLKKNYNEAQRELIALDSAKFSITPNACDYVEKIIDMYNKLLDTTEEDDKI